MGVGPLTFHRKPAGGCLPRWYFDNPRVIPVRCHGPWEWFEMAAGSSPRSGAGYFKAFPLKNV